MYKDIPSTAYRVAENDSVIVFINGEAIGDSIEGLPSVKQVSLWMYNRNKKEGRRILLSHPQTNMAILNMEHSVSIPKIQFNDRFGFNDKSKHFFCSNSPLMKCPKSQLHSFAHIIFEPLLVNFFKGNTLCLVDSFYKPNILV
jgi:hypothetical protein